MNWQRVFLFAGIIVGICSAFSCTDPLTTGDPRNVQVRTTVVVSVAESPSVPEAPKGSSIYITVTIHDTNQYSPAVIDTVSISGNNASNFRVDDINKVFPLIVPSGDTASFRLLFTPSIPGVYNSTINLIGDSNTETISVPIQAWGVNSLTDSVALLSDTLVNFGNVRVNPHWPGDTTASLPRTVIFKNNGTPFTLYGPLLSGANAGNFGVAGSIGQQFPHLMITGELDTFYVYFFPGTEIQYSATLSLQTNNYLPPSKVPSVSLIGVGTNDSTAFPNTGHYDSIIISSQTSSFMDTVSVHNTSTTPVSISKVQTSSYDTSYTETFSTNSIPAGDTGMIQIRWHGIVDSLKDNTFSTNLEIYFNNENRPSVEIPMEVR